MYVSVIREHRFMFRGFFSQTGIFRGFTPYIINLAERQLYRDWIAGMEGGKSGA
jgi:hypothetical protein